MSSKIHLVELFSGIGSQARALQNIGAEPRVVATCEWDIHAIVAYDLIHNRDMSIEPEFEKMSSKEMFEIMDAMHLSSEGKRLMDRNTLKALSDESKRRILSSIKRTANKIDIQQVKGRDLPKKIDIMTYSFPCQDLSNVGAFHGYTKGIDRDAGNRSCLLWEVERILLERRDESLPLPKFLLLENVPALLSERHKKNFDEWQDILRELGYYNKYFKLNATDFGCPQNRQRLLMISVFIAGREDIKVKLDEYFNTHNLEDPAFRATLNFKKTKLEDCLHMDYDHNPADYHEALQAQPNDTPSRLKIWEDNLKITDENGQLLTDHVATVTTKQDRNPNSGNLYFNPPNDKSRYRFLTPRECIRIMGFEEQDYDILQMGNCYPSSKYSLFTRDKIYRLAGNSISVKILEAVFSLIMEIREKNLARTVPVKKQEDCKNSSWRKNDRCKK